jgi:hypothetical protein
MAFGPKPVSRCREVTILCKMNRRDHSTTFKVWERNGLSGENAPLNVLYEGTSFAGAYAMLTDAAETIEEGLR